MINIDEKNVDERRCDCHVKKYEQKLNEKRPVCDAKSGKRKSFPLSLQHRSWGRAGGG